MKKLLFVLMMLCAVMNVQAQTIQVGQKFWDGYELYTVQEIRLGTIVYMTTKHGAELTLEKIAGKQGEYKLIPSRQADECPFGAEYGWRVKHIMQDGENFLAIRKPNGDVVWTMKLTKLNEQECEEMQMMMEQEEPWNAVNSVLLNRAYLHSMVSSKQELRLLRNKILAYHGYRFQSKDLQDYFGKISWYKPGNDNNAIKLDIIEQTNIQLIKSEEADRTEEILGDEPYWETEEAIWRISNWLEKSHDTSGSLLVKMEKSPFDLDKKYYSAYWNEVYNKVNEKESNATSAEQLFFVDDNHWTAGLETPVDVKDIKVEFLADTKAEATLTLVDKRHGQSLKAILILDFEEAVWRISNWLEKSHDTSGSLLVKMEKYIGL